MEQDDAEGDEADGGKAGGGDGFREERDAEGEGEDRLEAEDEDVGDRHFGSAHGEGLAGGSEEEQDADRERGGEAGEAFRVLHADAADGVGEGRGYQENEIRDLVHRYYL